MLHDCGRVRKAIIIICIWIVLTVAANVGQQFLHWPWLVPHIEGDPGMAVTTGVCFLGVVACFILLLQLHQD